jgi:hypothetical protein
MPQRPRTRSTRDRTCAQCRIAGEAIRFCGQGAEPSLKAPRAAALVGTMCLRILVFPRAAAANWSLRGQFFSSIINSTLDLFRGSRLGLGIS